MAKAKGSWGKKERRPTTRRFAFGRSVEEAYVAPLKITSEIDIFEISDVDVLAGIRNSLADADKVRRLAEIMTDNTKKIRKALPRQNPSLTIQILATLHIATCLGSRAGY